MRNRVVTSAQTTQYREDDFRHWIRWQLVIIKFVIAVMAILTAYRFIYFSVYKTGRVAEGFATDVLKSFIAGLRFDLMVALYFTLPLVLISLLLLAVFPRRASIYNASVKFAKVYLPVILMVVVLFCVLDYYYFRFFQSHINVLVFGIWQDDTKAVMQFVYSSYPVFAILIGIIICWFVIYKIIAGKWILKTRFVTTSLSLAAKSILCLVCFFLVFLGIRGTLPFPDSFPLRIDDGTVSTNTFINSVSLNPVFAFKEAFVDLETGSVERDMGKILDESGFRSVEEAFAFYKGRNTNSVQLDSFFNETAYNEFLEKNKPNVVFIQMESMSNQLIDFNDTNTLNLLGALQNELPSCYVFRNSNPCQNGTIHTLEGLMANTPRASVSQSPLMRHAFSGASALPFLNAGYSTHFITGAKLGWRNIEQFVPAQGFSDMEGDAAIYKNVPGTQSNEWGAYDEFLFERMFQMLSNVKKPAFIYSMTTTNHPRFFLPDTYKPLPVTLNPVLRQRRTADTSMLISNLITYQYANNCLGNFIKRVKASAFGKNTIIIATGDHNIHDLMNYSDAEMLQKTGVPIIIYMPDDYKPAYTVDTARFASHKDIFSTIYNHSLSKQRYFSFGNDLLQQHDNSNDFFFGIFDEYAAYSDDGVYVIPQKLYYRWKDKRNKLLEPAGATVSKGLDSLAKMANAYMVLVNYYLHAENERSKKK